MRRKIWNYDIYEHFHWDALSPEAKDEDYLLLKLLKIFESFEDYQLPPKVGNGKPPLKIKEFIYYLLSKTIFGKQPKGDAIEDRIVFRASVWMAQFSESLLQCWENSNRKLQRNPFSTTCGYKKYKLR